MQREQYWEPCNDPCSDVSWVGTDFLDKNLETDSEFVLAPATVQ